MEELKTLKDFENKAYTFNYTSPLLKELRAEAIKWVKETEKMPQCPRDELKEQLRMNDGARLWIKYFFNLTEEDLK